MPVTIEEIREIQAGLSGRNPLPEAQGTLTAPNGDPNSAPEPSEAGVSVLVSSGKSAIFTLLSVEKGASVTSYTIRWWGYVPARARWGALDDGDRADLERDFLQIVPSGPITRIYCELVAIVDGGAGDGVTPVISPCDAASD